MQIFLDGARKASGNAGFAAIRTAQESPAAPNGAANARKSKRNYKLAKSE